MKKIIPFTILLLSLTGCKTQEQIQREQQIQTMSVQMVENQLLTADSTVKLQTMEESILKFQGVLEESFHAKDQKSQKLEDRIKLLEELIKGLSTQVQEGQEKLTFVELRLSEQSKFIKEIIATLKKKAKKKPRKKKAKKRSNYNEAMFQYGKGRYKTARVQLEKLATNKKLSAKKRARILHNLGMISFIQKRDQDTITYFGKLFTVFPKSMYNANGMIHMAKTFTKLGQKEEAKETLNEMIKRYPKHKRVKIAKKLLSKL